MPLYKAELEATRPFKSHFREADILFTAANEGDAITMAEDFARLIQNNNDVAVDINSIYRIS